MNRFARPLGALALLTGAATAATTIPWQDLTEKDALFDLFTRKAVVDGRTIHYETPTEELAAALTTASAGPDAATATIALRHLAEAKLALGDRAGAKDALRSWAGKVATAQAWDEAAMWGAGRGETAFALEAAAKALAFQDAGSLERRLALASARIGWATSAGLDAATILDLRREQATLFPGDEARVSEYVTALEGAKRYDEARKVLAESKSLSKERRALLTSALEKRQGDAAGAYRTLEALVVAEETPSHELLRTFAALADEAAPGAILEARTRLEKSLDRRSLLLLARYFDGKSRGDLGSSLLTQVLLRHESTASPADLRLVSSLFGALDAVPEAFRTRLAAAKGSSKDDQLGDLAELSVLALRAGSRPLAWGVYGEEPYRWAARVDVTPGFSTGALSFLLTGFDGESALSELESRRMPERTFATAKRLAQELEKRAPKDPRLPALRVGLMSRHVERGEGAEALKLLPLVEAGDAETRAEARRLALLAMRQTKAPLAEETKLWKERLRLLGPEGQTSMAPQVESEEGGNEDEEAQPSASRSSLLERAVGRTSNDRYDSVLREAVSRLNARDTTKKTALDLLLGELDRRPKDERLWLYAAGEISGWNLEDGLEARYRTALDTFGSAGWWDRLARFYARRKKAAELRALVDDLVARFRVAQIFQYAPRIQDLVAVDPASGHPNPFIFFGDAVRLAALERFPQSVTVVKEAESALVAREDYARLLAQKHIPEGRGTVPRSFLTERQNAILFADAPRRSSLIDQLVREKRLQPLLGELERNPQRTPVENLFLAEGWARLSRYEEATPHADALAAAYPGSEEFALQAVTLHRSLSGLDSSHLASVSKTIARTAPALTDPSALFTQEAEASFDLDRAEAAKASVAKLVASAPRGATRDATRVLDAATLLWDYGHMREALTTLETGRKLLDRPRLHAFEAGVLREEVKDLPGAIDEYIGALRGEESWSGGESWGEGEYRARNRLARLLSRKNVLRLFEERIGALQPGIAKDEELLATYLVLLTLEPESREGGIWDDWMDAPRDSVGRDERATARDAAIPKERQGLAQAGAMLLAKTKLMVLKATRIPFLEAVRSRKSGLLRKEVTSDPAEDVNLEVALLTREAELQPTEERRLSREAAKADLLLANGRRAEATAVWASLLPRVEKLPEGADRVRRFAAWARFVETSGGDAAAAWTKVAAAYPWSLGVLEDRVQQLLRSPQPAAGLEVLEAVTAKAASGHRERLLERLAKESLDRGDLPRAERATSALLASKEIDDSRRIAIAGLRSRLGLRSTSFDAMAFAKEEAKKLPTDRHADLYAAVAEAAREERKAPLAVDLYVESLNRSMDQERLRTAARVAVSGGRAPQLLTFFEKQRERSPRDVRWAVAVREIKTFSGDLEGALVAAKQAVEVAPEREYLWRDATTLLERLLRFQEAADYLDGYAKARRASESVAEWRAKLYLRAGNVPKALEVERASIDAYRKEAAAAGKESEEIESEAGARLARAARRFLWAQAPDAAWQMAFPKGVSSALPEALGVSERAEIALRTGNFPALLKRFAADEDFRNQAAEVVSRVATHEQLAELEALLLARIFPATGSPSEAELTRWHGFAQTAGLHRFGEALARKHLASASRPWGVDPPAAFLAERDVVAWRSNPSRAYFSPRTWVGDWARYLEKRDEREKLLAVIGPLVDAIDRVVKAPAPVVPNPDAYDVPPSAVVLALEGPDQEARRAMVSSWLANVNLWNRVRTVTQTWEGAGLLPLADEPSRQAFLARSTPAAALDEVLVARRKVEARVSTALVALVKGEPGALQNDDVVRLRGPRSVGEVLGTEAKFTWPELAPRARETGDDAVFGTGVDEGRLPGRLWGSRPGDSWYVLETLARYREKEPTSPYVPLEVPGRGAESERTLLAGRTAEALGDGALALTLDETYFADLTKRERLSRRLRLLVKNGRKADADALFAKEILARQKTADADAFLSYRVLSKEHGLADPLTLLDTNAVVSPQLKAFLVDTEGPARFASLRSTDEVIYRSTLASRWIRKQDSLSAEKTVFHLDELWARGHGDYPARAAAKTSPLWPVARPWLARLDSKLRARGLAAVRALPDPTLLEAFVTESRTKGDDSDLLLLSADLAASRDDAALARLSQALEQGTSSINWQEPQAQASSESEGGEDGEGESESRPPAAAPAAAEPSRLVPWLRTFRATKRASVISRAEELLRARVAKDLDAPYPNVATWALAIDLSTTPEAVAQTVAGLELAWARGDSLSEEDRRTLVKLLVPKSPEAVARWIPRLAPADSFAAAKQRAEVFVAKKDFDSARKEWTDARKRLPLSRDEERDAFDAWRKTSGTPTASASPAPWMRALAFWQKKGPALSQWGGELAAHLQKQPYDRLAARVVLRSLAPAPETSVAPALLALQASDEVGSFRIARFELARSPRAAKNALNGGTPRARALAQRSYPRAEIDALLADTARIGAGSGDSALVNSSLAQLEERKALVPGPLREELQALRARFAAPAAGIAPPGLRPQDLTWALYSRVLSVEKVP